MNSNEETFEIDAEDVILLLLEANERINQTHSLNGITRLEKLVFLLKKETAFSGVANLFKFTAYNFGPFSKEVYEAIDFLESCELITVSEKAHSSIYSRAAEEKMSSEIPISEEEGEEIENSVQPVRERIFHLTDNGRKISQQLRKALEKEDVSAINSIVSKYSRLSLGQLIRYVYHQFKDMTVNSIHPEAKRVVR